MKSLLLLSQLFIFAAFQSSFAQDQKCNDLYSYGFKSNVKSVTEIYSKAIKKSGEIKKTKKSILEKEWYIVFDDQGFLIEYSSYNTDGSLSKKKKYMRDNMLNIIEENTFDAKENMTHSEKSAFEYDDDGNKTEKIHLQADGRRNGKATYKYDSTGNLLEMDSYLEDGVCDEKKTWKYDDEGNVSEMIEHKIIWVSDFRSIYKVDSSGKIVEETLYTKGTKFLSKYIYSYDSNGNCIEYDICKENGKASVKWTYSYAYDTNLNWIQKTKCRNDKPISILERKIEYY